MTCKQCEEWKESFRKLNIESMGFMNKYTDLKKQLAKKDAEIKQLKENLDKALCAYCGFMVSKSDSRDNPLPLADHILSCENSPLVKLIKRLEGDIKEKGMVIERMEEALGFYADGKNWRWAEGSPFSDIDCDGGEKAREALKEVGDECSNVVE